MFVMNQYENKCVNCQTIFVLFSPYYLNSCPRNLFMLSFCFATLKTSTPFKTVWLNNFCS